MVLAHLCTPIRFQNEQIKTKNPYENRLPTMQNGDYLMSFSTGGLFYREAVIAAESYLHLGDWEKVRDQIVRENTLHARTQAASIRTSRELCNRLKQLTDRQLQVLIEGSRQEQNQILWLAVCKQYRFAREFAEEVIRNKFLRLDFELNYADFDIFFNNKADWHEELEILTDTTRKKLRQVLFRMLTEAEILSKTHHILPAFISPLVGRTIAEDDPGLFSIFPINDLEIQRQMNL